MMKTIFQRHNPTPNEALVLFQPDFSVLYGTWSVTLNYGSRISDMYLAGIPVMFCFLRYVFYSFFNKFIAVMWRKWNDNASAWKEVWKGLVKHCTGATIDCAPPGLAFYQLTSWSVPSLKYCFVALTIWLLISELIGREKYEWQLSQGIWTLQSLSFNFLLKKMMGSFTYTYTKLPDEDWKLESLDLLSATFLQSVLKYEQTSSMVLDGLKNPGKYFDLSCLIINGNDDRCILYSASAVHHTSTIVHVLVRHHGPYLHG